MLTLGHYIECACGTGVMALPLSKDIVSDVLFLGTVRFV